MYLNPTGHLGGAESSLLDILASVRRAEPSWLLHLVAASDGPLIARAQALGVTTEVLHFPRPLRGLGEHGALASGGLARFAAGIALASPAALWYQRALRRTIAAFRPDVVHTNGLKMHLLGAWANRSNAALVWHVLGNVPNAGWPVPLRDAIAASGVPATRLPPA